jgi:Family of unknown function (DUF6498)
MFKRTLSLSDVFMILINLIPLWGVWFDGWDPKQMFMIYCAESIIVGLFTILKMLIVTQIKKKDIWENNGAQTMVSGYFFILFFILHYGFFVSIQLAFFFNASGLLHSMNPIGILLAFPSLMDNYTKGLLLGFIAVYALLMLKDFIFTGEFRNVSLGKLMFSPYMRIFVQQFAVITGVIFLSFGGGKIFMLIFVSVKIFFEVFVNYDRMLNLAEKRQRIREKINQSGKQ